MRHTAGQSATSHDGRIPGHNAGIGYRSRLTGTPIRKRSLVQLCPGAYREVMFFEPVPAGEETATAGFPEQPPWSGPPALETGGALAVEQTVARSANVIVRLPTLRAFHSGCMFDVEVVSRQRELSEDDWWDLHSSVYGGYHRLRGGAPLPRRLLRLGVRYADGRKATTVESRLCPTRSCDEPPSGPLLALWPGSSGMHGREVGFSSFGLWLWPLPPEERIEFAVEWPFGGIELTITELDGGAIVAAASQSAYYWPGTSRGNQS
jgi:hypothetical protein